jgi:predicted dehydrogenase
MDDLLIGIVGAGEVTRRAHLPVLLNMPGVRVAWLHDHRAERADSLARSYGVTPIHATRNDEMPPCDVALLAIPVEVRGDYLNYFRQNSTAILCEKPFALTAAEHAKAIGEIPPHRLGCGYMRRFYRSTMVLRQIVVEGFFGPLLAMSIYDGDRSKGSGVDSSFLDDTRMGASRGVLADLGSHSIDLALHISGAEAFRVKSLTRVMDGSVDRKVVATVQLDCPTLSGNHSVDLHYGVSWLDRLDNCIRLRFEHATVWSGLAASSEVYVGDPTRPDDAIMLNSPVVGASTFNQAFYLEWRDFLDGVRLTRESLVSARSALLTTALVEQLSIDAAASHD